MEDDGKTWAQYLMEEKARQDYAAGLKYAEERGEARGIAKGEVRGITKGKVEVAEEMFKFGLSFDAIKTMTKLSDEELADIQKSSPQPK